VKPPRRDEIERLAELAALEVEPSAVDGLTAEIASIIAFISQIDSLGFTLGHPSPGDAGCARPLHLRPDEVEVDTTIADPATFAPEFDGGFFVVPKPESMGGG